MTANRLVIFSFIGVFAFLFSLNLLLPPLSDDFDAYFAAQNGFESAKSSYLNWNARIGELIFQGFVAGLNPFVFDVLNAIVGSGFIFAFFALVFGRIPRYKKDIALIATMLILILITTMFGSIFLWGAGSLNYLWGISFIILFLLPYRFYVEKALIKNGGGNQDSNKLYLNLLSPFGFIAGMASEQIGIITIISLLCIGLYLKFYRRINLPIWYILGFSFFILGFLCLYFSPGHAARASLDVFKGTYLSIPQLFELSFIDKMMRIIKTLNKFGSSTFAVFSVFLIILVVLKYQYKSTNKIRDSILCTLGLIILLVLNNNAVSILFIANFILLYKLIKKDKFYLSIFFIFIIFTLTALSTIQFPALPARARFGDSLMLIASILLILNHIVQDCKKFILISSIIFICYGGFVASAYIKFRLDWNAMVAYIQQEKQMEILTL